MPLVARLAVAWGINLAALWVADALFDGVRIDGAAAFLIGAAVLGIANAILKPVLALLTLPLIVVTLGLFLLVINIAMVAFAEWVAPDFSVDGFWAYVGTVFVVWLVNWIGQMVVDSVEPRRSPLARF
jgi:putative membrane protein